MSNAQWGLLSFVVVLVLAIAYALFRQRKKKRREQAELEAAFQARCAEAELCFTKALASAGVPIENLRIRSGRGVDGEICCVARDKMSNVFLAAGDYYPGGYIYMTDVPAGSSEKTPFWFPKELPWAND